MYDTGKVLGVGGLGGGAIVLPNTGGNRILTVAAVTSIVLGVVVIASSVISYVAKKV